MKSVTTKNSTFQSLLKLSGYFGALFALFFVSQYLFAEGGGDDLGKVADNITSTMSSVGKLIVAASYVAGVGFALMGMLKFKAHKDQPQQVPLSQPIVLLAIAAGLVFLPSLITTSGATIFKGGKEGSSKGTGVKGLE